jgi:hypothetical protein
MEKLRLAELEDDTPVKLTIELPGSLHRDLVAYAEALNGGGGPRLDPSRLVVPMLARFMGTDRAFARFKRRQGSPKPGGQSTPHSGKSGSLTP